MRRIYDQKCQKNLLYITEEKQYNIKRMKKGRTLLSGITYTPQNSVPLTKVGLL